MFKSLIKTSIRSTNYIQSRKMHAQYIKMRWGTGDNYAYLLTDDSTSDSWIIDPAEPHE